MVSASGSFGHLFLTDAAAVLTTLGPICDSIWNFLLPSRDSG